jgi:CTP:molybdopterin cytidylyltransferase MocA
MKKLKLCALIAAAGQSRRMGFPKALLAVNSQPAIINLAQKFLRAQFEKIYITLPKILLVNNYIKSLCEDLPVKLLPNRFNNYDYAGSIMTAVQDINYYYDGIVITPVDAIFLSEDLIINLGQMANFYADKKIIIIPTYNFIPGHPVYLSKDYFSLLANCYKFNSLRDLIYRNKKHITYIYWPDKYILANYNNNLFQFEHFSNFGKTQYELSALTLNRYAINITTKAIHGHFTVSKTHACAKLSS